MNRQTLNAALYAVAAALAVGAVVSGVQGVDWGAVWNGKPEPVPQPVVPTPVVPGGPLASLVPDTAFRGELVTFYSDLADLVERDIVGQIETTEEFRNAQQAAVVLLTQRRGLAVQPGFNKAISDRITAAIGLEPVVMDSTKRAALAQTLRGIAGELQ